jgi:AraC family transcriptional regulator
MPEDTQASIYSADGMLTRAQFEPLPSRPTAMLPRSPGGLWDAMAVLIEAMNCALVDDNDDARRHALSACKMLENNSATWEGLSPPEPTTSGATSCRGGLAAWQVRRVSAHIEMHLAEKVLCDELAHIVRLSVSHFIRAFKESLGESPHMYITRRRVERAQGMMLSSTAPLGQIALDCGLADQAHLSRLFKRIVGESPAAWRRARTQ